MNSIVITVEKAAIQEVLRTIEYLQEGMDVLREESTVMELKAAYHNHGIAQGYIRCIKDLELISGSDYNRLFTNQFKNGEKLRDLQERRVCSENSR